MAEQPGIRTSNPGDRAAIESLYRAAFPEEDLLPLVRELLDSPAVATSLVAAQFGQLAGHVVLTRCGVAEDQPDSVLLGPLAVAPDRQGRGIGSMLVRDGIERFRQAGSDRCYVLGDPAFYGRFGFQPELRVEPPYPFPSDLPAEWRGAWQSVALNEGSENRSGRLRVPAPWHKPELWAP